MGRDGSSGRGTGRGRIPEAVRMAEADLNPTVVIVATEVVLSAGVSRLATTKWEEGSCNKNHGLSIIERPRS